MRAWLTPDSLPGTATCVGVMLPDSDEMRAAFRGALCLLQNEYNWEKHGNIDPVKVADMWSRWNSETFQGSCSVVEPGRIIMGAWTDAPSGYLLCDGGSYETYDYPDLFGVIGYSFGGSGSAFNVPNLQDSFPMGASEYNALASTGGERETTLSVNNLPPHRHEETRRSFISSMLQLGPNQINTISSIVTVNSGSTGSGTPFTNLPPYVALNFAIKA